MGNGISEEERKAREEKELHFFVSQLKEAPDVKVNKNIVMFCSLSASEKLQQHYERRKMGMGDRAADWIKDLVEKLRDLTPAPALAGLGALAIAVFIDVVSFSPPEESVKEALRSVFAEEKASEVWDQIDECLKRCSMNVNIQDELKNDIKRIEIQLSDALTKLKNSMVRDGQMTNSALKAWVNGAAFHIQMLIHLVRLGGIQTCDPVKSLLSFYEKDLDQLFENHREMIRSKCKKTISGNVDNLFIYLVDEDSKWYVMCECVSFDKYVDRSYNHKYLSQKREIQQHFSEIRENLQSLVQQVGSFNVE